MIREAAKADWPAIHKLRADTDEYLHGISKEDNAKGEGTALVDEEDGKIVGCVWYHLGVPETWIRSVAVDPGFRDQNIARKLIAQVMILAKQQGSSAVEGFEAKERKDWVAYAKKRGAHITEGYRVRYPLTDYTMARAKTLTSGGDPDQLPPPKESPLDTSSEKVGKYTPHNPEASPVVPPPRQRAPA